MSDQIVCLREDSSARGRDENVSGVKGEFGTVRGDEDGDGDMLTE